MNTKNERSEPAPESVPTCDHGKSFDEFCKDCQAGEGQAPIREAKADPAQADGWFHCEICGKAGEDVSERDFPGLDGETYQLYAHPGCGKPPKISLDLDPAQGTGEG